MFKEDKKARNIIELKKETKLALYLTIFIPLIILIIMVFYNVLSENRTRSEIYLDLNKNTFINGRIDSLYHQKNNHNVLTIISNNHEFEVARKWENKFKVGDSVSKAKGDLLLKHYRGEQLIEILNYKDLVKDWQE